MNRFAFFVLAFLVLSVSVSAESLIEGRVRLASGEPVANAQVRIFDMTDLGRGVIARATTDGTGHFALSLRVRSMDTGTVLPTDFALGQNYPNPFNPSTIIPYQLPTAGRVRLEVFNILGQHLATLVDAERAAGFHTAQWDGTDKVGRAMGAGVYIYRLRSGGMTETGRMVLVDGQAGIPAAPGSVWASGERVVGADSPDYGLTVSGVGLIAYVNPAFGVRAGTAPVEVVVESVEGLPRGKALTGGVLGDVNGDGRVDLEDALLIMTLLVEGSVELPPNGDLSLGDVNGDGQVDLVDASLLVRYVANPADASLPSGIGQAVSGGGGLVAGAIRRLTEHSDDPWFSSWSPDGRHIAFESYRDGNFEIYVMDSDGSNQRNLTNHSADDWGPSWSPDGHHIAFVSARDGKDGDIYVMDSDGSNQRRLTDHRASDYSPSWSPDGRHIAFESARDGNFHEIYVMSSDGSNQRNLTNHSADDREPSWSPDGRHIAFASYRDGNRDIYVMGSDGSNPRRLTNHSANDKYPSWSPDGRHIAFESYRDGNFEIYVMGSDGSNPRRLTNHSADDKYPSWSPDGRHIAFASYRDGNGDIYVMEFRQEGDRPSSSLDDLDPDRAVLVALYEATDGDNWGNNTNWLSAAPLGEWFGVTTDDDGRVRELRLPSNDLRGEIPASLGQLQNLTRLFLFHNPLSGALPSSLVNLTNLEWLILEDTQLCAPTDDAFQTWLEGITKFGVKYCGESDPVDLDRAVLVALYEAEAKDEVWGYNTNWLSDAPLGEWFGVTTDDDGRVARLWLHNNDLSGEIPVSLGQLQNLTDLHLDGNWLRGEIPVSLGQLQNLTYLHLGNNDLSGEIPVSLGQLQNLTYLHLGNNDLSGEIPVSLGQLQNLTDLSLAGNPLSGALPSSLVNLLSLELLNLEDTQLCVPTDDAFQTWLKGIERKSGVKNCGEPDPDRAVLVALLVAMNADHLWDNYNWLSDTPLGEWEGVITDDDGRVTYLDLGDYNLGGEIPVSLGQLQNLTGLNLSDNDLSGEIPVSLGQLQNLTGLNLSGNDLSGEIPASLGQLQNLVGLYLSDNDLSGEIPVSLGQLQNLTYLELGGNGLSGALPSSLVNLTNLEWLILEDTQLCAPTDDAFQTWLEGIDDKRGVVNCGEDNPDRAVLVALYEATGGGIHWGFSWRADVPLGRWHGVTTDDDGRVTRLKLPYYVLSGEIPASLGQLQNLTYLELSASPGLSGEIPASLGQLQNLTYLELGGNDLSGEIPASLGQLQNLTYLALGYNDLSGEIPASLGQLQNLTYLDLAENDLSGEIPASLGRLPNLRELHLGGNGLSGALPSSLVNLISLELLILEDTQLCVPTDDAFQTWLEGIERKFGVRYCQGN